MNRQRIRRPLATSVGLAAFAAAVAAQTEPSNLNSDGVPPPASADAASPDDEVVVLEPFVVRPLIDERNRAIDAKRETIGISDFVSSDRLGQFVDDDIGAVLERIPGVYTSGAGQSGGDGVSIRGLGGGFNSLQLDGDRLPSNQGGTRGVSLDNIPAELVSAIEVSKAPTPDKDADAIGGIVDVETKSGLSLDRRVLAGRAAYGFDEYGDGTTSRVSLNFADKISDTLGVFLSVNRKETKDSLRDEIRADPTDALFDQLATEDIDAEIDENTDPTFYTPGRIDYRRTLQSQTSTGGSLNLDWRPAENHRISLRTFYNEFDEKREQLRNSWRFDRSDGDDPDGEEFGDSDFVYRDPATGIFYFGDDQRINRRVYDQNETETIYRVQLASDHRWGDSHLELSASYARAERDFAADIFVFETDDVQLFVDNTNALRPRAGIIDTGDFFYMPGSPVPGLQDPASYVDGGGDGEFIAAERRGEVINATDEIQIYAADYRRDFENSAGRGFWKTGVKLRRQDKVNDRDFAIVGGGFNFDANASGFQDANGFFNGLSDVGVFPTYGGLRAQNPMTPEELVADALANSPSPDARRDSTVLDISAMEDVFSLYGMASQNFGGLTVTGGVRWERTDTTYSGFTANVTGDPVLDALRAVESTSAYDDFYPSIHFTYRLTDQSLLRFSAGRTLARPEFDDLTPSTFATLNVDSGTGDTIVNLQRGNADLSPTQSLNLDLSYEYYFKDGGIFSAAVFYKELDNWIYEGTLVADPAQFPEYAAVPNLVGVRVNSTLNGDTARLTGFELNYERSFGAGFSGGVNYTMISFDVNEQETGLDRVPGQAEQLLRASLAYETRKLTLRLSARYSSPILDERVSFSDPAAIAFYQGQGMGTMTTDLLGNPIVNLGLYEEEGVQLDFTGEYALTKNVRAFVQVNNLLGENGTTLLEENKRFAEKNEYKSWSALVGVKFSL